MASAFVGQPQTENGKALACAYCDRGAALLVGCPPEPRCAHHATGRLSPALMNEAAAQRRRRARV